MEKCLFPFFKDNGKMPFAYGATYKRTDPPTAGLLEKQKALADRVWQMETTKIIYRAVHGCMDKDSENFVDAFNMWCGGDGKKHPIRALFSVDGVFKGASDCDWTTVKGKIQRRPSMEQLRSFVRFLLDKARQLFFPDGSPEYAIEYLPKAVNKDACSQAALEVISEECERKFGKAPENFGEYPNDWVEPLPSPPPTIDIEVCKESGLLPNEWCPAKEIKTFIKGEEPTTTCGVHKEPGKPRWVRILEWIKQFL
jgi:hypothetical protein